MRIYFYIFLLLSLCSATRASLSLCSGESVECFDSEAQKWMSFANSDTCVDYPDSGSHNGWKTTSYCAKDGRSPIDCSGQSVDCFDYEQQKWITFPSANTCEDYPDSSSHNGWKTRAYCK